MATVLVTGCSTNFSGDTIDYKSAGEKKTPNLAFPPDLSNPTADKRYSVSDGATTLSQYNLNTSKSDANKAVVTPAELGIRIVREGDKRWLVIKQPTATLYPKVKEFWESSGFLLTTDLPKVGIMETDWAENRAKIPQDIIRRTLGSALDSIYSTGERDKFKTRFEPNDKGETEIYISHRGAVEELIGTYKDTSKWTGRPSDPELEAEMLTRLMAYLGTAPEAAKVAIQQAKGGEPVPTVSRVSTAGEVVTLTIAQGFDRAWREVGLGLDRSNFTVEDRDRAKGVYFVRFVNPKDLESEKSPGFFANLFKSNKTDDLKKAKRYQVVVKSGGDLNASKVTVQTEDGKSASIDAASQILNLLDQEVSR